MVDGLNELAGEGISCANSSEMLYADDLILMSKTIDGFRNKFKKLKQAYDSKGLKVNFGKTKLTVSGNIMKDGR